MQCIKCGTQNEPLANYCSSCGNPFSFSEVASSQGIYKKPAGFWKRFGAFVIDWMVLSVLKGFCIFVIILLFGSAVGLSGNIAAIPFGMVMISGLIGIGFGFNWLYYTFMESSYKQATLGKMALGIVVTDDQGRRISLARANGRYWSKILSGFFLCLGYIMAGFTAKKQALHDLIASTLVVDE